MEAGPALHIMIGSRNQPANEYIWKHSTIKIRYWL